MIGYQNIPIEAPGGISQTHLVPIQDILAHRLSEACTCHPVEDHEVPDLWIHTAWDGRDDYVERGRKLN